MEDDSHPTLLKTKEKARNWQGAQACNDEDDAHSE